MEEFLLLVHGNHYNDESEEAMEEHAARYYDWMNSLISSGKFIKGHRLENRGNLVLENKTVISDGPFLESKEAVGGYIIIRAENLSEATQITKTCPLSEEFKISIRPMFPGPSNHEYPKKNDAID